MVDDVENYMRDMSKRLGYDFFEKDRDDMRFLSKGMSAFFVAFHLKEDPVLFITNVGAGTVLTLSVQDYGNVPLNDLKMLGQEIIEGLQREFSIHLEPALP